MKYVAYYRVSTQRQGRSGLGLNAQRDCVEVHAGSNNGEIIGEYVEVESGSKNQRVELEKALAFAKKKKATLIVAKLDRLSRNASFLLTIRDSNIDVTACDMPSADKLMFGMMALLAEWERDKISERTTVALAAAKKRGQRLGNPNGIKNFEGHNEQRSSKASVIAESVRSIVDSGIKSGRTLRQIASDIESARIPTASGNTNWRPAQVARCIQRLGLP